MEIEYRNIRPAKRWGIKEPVQTKFGSWYGFIADPDNNEIVFETYGFSKKMTFDCCVEWCMTNNRYAAEIEASKPKPIEVENVNADTTTMGQTLAENCSGNSTIEQGPVNTGGSSSSIAGQ